MNITNWPVNERPREKLINCGAHSLSDAELLAIFIRNGIKGKTAVDLAMDMLKKMGNIRLLLDATFEDFCQFPGLGLSKYVTLQASLEISRRYLHETIKREDIIQNPDDLKAYLSTCLRNLKQETFAVLFLDNQNRVICYEELFQGSINKTNVYPREVIKKALAHNAAAVIIAHNHPSGTAEASENDKEITKELFNILKHIDIRLLDHVIVGDHEMLSFAEQEML